MKSKKHNTSWMVSVALMAAIIIVLANTPLGMIQLPVIKATLTNQRVSCFFVFIFLLLLSFSFPEIQYIYVSVYYSIAFSSRQAEFAFSSHAAIHFYIYFY